MSKTKRLFGIRLSDLEFVIFQLSPQPGLMESLTIIVSFHHLFITKVDRALNIQCFYSQMNEVRINKEIDIRSVFKLVSELV